MTALPAGPNRGDLVRTFRNFHSSTGLIAICVLVFAVGFNLVLLYPEVAVESIGGNDRVMHLLFSETAVQAITRGQDFTDPWLGTMGMGIPAFHHYQHLPHVSVALVHVGTLGVFPLADMLRWTTYLLLSLFPLSIYWSLRRFGFDQLTAAMGGLVASLIVTPGIFGFGYISYVWRGHGLYSQLWAMLLMPPAIAIGYRVLREGRGYFWATLLLAATLMSHVLYVYMAFLTLGILTLIQPIQISNPMSLAGTLLRSWRRLIILFLLVVVVTSYFLVPFFLDLEYFNRSVWTDPRKFNSYGHSALVSSLVSGQLFDGVNRIPSLTYLVFLGFIVCLLRRRNERHLIPIAIFLLWLMLYFGRETWGSLIDLLPFSRDIHMHRFIGGVHLGGIFLIAVALAAPLRWAVSQSSIWRGWYVTAALSLTMLVLLPAYSERTSYLQGNALGLRKSHEGLDVMSQELSALLEKLKQLPPGRVYAGQKMPPGRRQNWGYRYNIGLIRPYDLLHAEGLDMVGKTYHGYSLNSDVMIEFDERRWDHYNLYNARYVVPPKDIEFPEFVQPLQQFGRLYLYQVKTTGYFDLVDSRMAFAGDRDDFNPASLSWLESGLPRAKQYPVVSLDGFQDVGSQLPLAEASSAISEVRISTARSRGGITSEEVGGNFFAAAVRVERDSTLLIKATYHPNWQATVDGEKADTFMVMPGFMGVRLASGDHQVRVEYQPRSFRLVLLVLGLVTLGLVLVVEKRGVVISGWLSTSPFARISNPLKMRQRPESGQERRRRRRQ